MKKTSAPPSEIACEELQATCTAAGCPLPEDALPRLKEYLELLMRWNRVMNLVGARHWRDALKNLIMDSFVLARFLERLSLPEDAAIWDLGAGAGLPGIPLRMVWHRGRYTLVEAREKRALFLSTVLARLGLEDTDVFRGRAEAFFVREAERPAHLVLSRAFLPWHEVLALIEPAVRPDAVAVFLMLEPAPHTLPSGWRCEATHTYTVGGGARYFWALRRCGA